MRMFLKIQEINTKPSIVSKTHSQASSFYFLLERLLTKFDVNCADHEKAPSEEALVSESITLKSYWNYRRSKKSLYRHIKSYC